MCNISMIFRYNINLYIYSQVIKYTINFLIKSLKCKIYSLEVVIK